jgi:hypothetical protein
LKTVPPSIIKGDCSQSPVVEEESTFEHIWNDFNNNKKNLFTPKDVFASVIVKVSDLFYWFPVTTILSYMYTVFLSFSVFISTWLLTCLLKFLNMLLEHLLKK